MMGLVKYLELGTAQEIKRNSFYTPYYTEIRIFQDADEKSSRLRMWESSIKKKKEHSSLGNAPLGTPIL